ncbi:potassium channel family protein [Halorubrum kocurii]|uniref:Trk potassium uptake system protein n=1 Tax=Halorubrum kocurii JCM 14978 TaxID=1230456 RepID=M0NG57_9EURY|nr:TrkA family potassium uptake protein [Halorubrum kocurii]EMA56962.1 Trk potassium uptake system protein [Halorubrum kocurii JCM 14978]WKF46062.1 TrkA family potassium uptake protein [Halorubrum kocurii]
MYLIVVGAGDIGTPLVKLATESGNEVVVIESDEERAERASRTYDCLVINDDATSKETLQDAGADRADALISTTDQDATNIMVCLLAQELSVPNIVSVVHNPEHMNVFEQIGVNTMQNPQSLIAEYLYRAVSRPSVVDFMHIGEEAEVFEISVGTDAPIVGKTLREADEAGLIGDQTLIVAVERDGEETPITPRGNTRIESDDLLTVYSGSGVTPEVTDVFGHTEDHG